MKPNADGSMNFNGRTDGTIDERVRRLETGCRKGSVPGTEITRVLMASKLLAQHGLAVLDADRESHVVWCVALGPLLEPKVFFYGHTIDGALQRAEGKISRREARVE